MYADRYAPRRVNRGSLTLSVAIVATLAAAAMTSHTVRTALRDKPLITYTVPPAPTPPKPEPLPQSKVKPEAKAVRQPIDRTPAAEQPTAPDTPFVDVPLPPYAGAPDGGTALGTGTGGVGTIDPPKPPPPVLTSAEVDPRYARAFQPLYPPAEQRAGRDGVVTLKVLVGVDGRVIRADQVMATSDEFWRVTLKQALERWRFKPATRDGIPVESWRTMTVRFRIADQ